MNVSRPLGRADYQAESFCNMNPLSLSDKCINEFAKVTVIILTYNEEVNLQAALKSVVGWAAQILVVDSYSNDETLKIAENCGVSAHQNPWTDWATQRNWALDNLPIRNEWVLFLDADERVTAELAEEIGETLRNVRNDVNGFYINRRFVFLGRELRHGGYNPNWVLRLVRRNKTRVLPAGDSEYFKVEGTTSKLKSFMIHEDKKDLSFFIDKHNKICKLAANRLFNRERISTEHKKRSYALEGKRRVWLKESILNKLPLFLRPFFLFGYKYIFRLGFLDGKEGLIYYFLHDFWYPFLVDAKILEIKKRVKD